MSPRVSKHNRRPMRESEDVQRHRLAHAHGRYASNRADMAIAGRLLFWLTHGCRRPPASGIVRSVSRLQTLPEFHLIDELPSKMPVRINVAGHGRGLLSAPTNTEVESAATSRRTTLACASSTHSQPMCIHETTKIPIPRANLGLHGARDRPSNWRIRTRAAVWILP